MLFIEKQYIAIMKQKFNNQYAFQYTLKIFSKKQYVSYTENHRTIELYMVSNMSLTVQKKWLKK